MNDPWQIQIGFRKGHAIGVHPATGTRASVRLRPLAQRLARKRRLPPAVAGEEFYSLLDAYDDSPNAPPVVSGKIARKMKKGLKKVAAVAKKVVNNKIVKTLGGFVTKLLPPPLKQGFDAISNGVKVAKKLVGAVKGSKAAKAKPIVTALAAGQITRQQAEARSRSQGLPPAKVVNAGVALKLRADANAGNPQARALFNTYARVEAARSSPQAANQAAQMILDARQAS